MDTETLRPISAAANETDSIMHSVVEYHEPQENLHSLLSHDERNTEVNQ